MSSPVPTAATATMLDEQALANLRALDPVGRNHLLERVARAFESSADRLVPQMRHALASGDHEAIRHVAHTLKSSSASVGALELSRCCAEIETRVREQRTDGLETLVAVALEQIAGVREALRQLVEARG